MGRMSDLHIGLSEARGAEAEQELSYLRFTVGMALADLGRLAEEIGRLAGSPDAVARAAASQRERIEDLGWLISTAAVGEDGESDPGEGVEF